MPSYFVWLPFGKIIGFLVFQLSVFTTAGHWQQRSRQRAHVIRPKQFCWFPFRYVRCGNLHFDTVGLSNWFRFLHNTLLLSLFRSPKYCRMPSYNLQLLFAVQAVGQLLTRVQARILAVANDDTDSLSALLNVQDVLIFCYGMDEEEIG